MANYNRTVSIATLSAFAIDRGISNESIMDVRRAYWDDFDKKAREAKKAHTTKHLTKEQIQKFQAVFRTASPGDEITRIHQDSKRAESFKVKGCVKGKRGRNNPTLLILENSKGKEIEVSYNIFCAYPYLLQSFKLNSSHV